MKKTVTLLLMLLLSAACYSQLQIGYHYRIKSKLGIKYKPDSLSPVQDKKIAPENTFLKANIIPDPKIPGKLKIDFWGFSKDNHTGEDEYVNSSDNADSFYTEVATRTTLTVSSFKSIPYSTWELGVTTIPFKLRFKHQINDTLQAPNDVSTAINGGLYIGRKWGRTRFYSDNTPVSTISVTAAGFIGPTLIAVAPENTFPKAKVKSNELGISTGLGVQLSKADINIGVFGGCDFKTSSAGKDWYYSNRFWVGFGIGYKLAILNGGK